MSLNATDILELKKISLKKDEYFKAFIEYKDVKKLFRFRWTLYHNEVLVVFSDFDQISSQHILRLNYNNQSFKVVLYPKGVNYNPPYLLVKFVKFDFKKKSAIFSLLIYDNNKEINVRYLNGDG